MAHDMLKYYIIAFITRKKYNIANSVQIGYCNNFDFLTTSTVHNLLVLIKIRRSRTCF